MRSTKSPNLELFSERTSSIWLNVKLKNWASFFLFYYEFCLIRIKEQVDKKRSTVCTHWYANCLLTNTSTKHNKHVVNPKLEHVDHISFREPFGSRYRKIYCYKLFTIVGVYNRYVGKYCSGLCWS